MATTPILSAVWCVPVAQNHVFRLEVAMSGKVAATQIRRYSLEYMCCDENWIMEVAHSCSYGFAVARRAPKSVRTFTYKPYVRTDDKDFQYGTPNNYIRKGIAHDVCIIGAEVTLAQPPHSAYDCPIMACTNTKFRSSWDFTPSEQMENWDVILCVGDTKFYAHKTTQKQWSWRLLVSLSGRGLLRRLSATGFKYAPRNAYQVYRIFGFVLDTHCVPLVTAILTGKSEEIYDKTWAAVANVLPDYMFDYALFDFEPASIAAFKRRFPEAFAKCTLYQDGGHVRSIIRRIGAIITVPPQYMDEAIILMFRAIDRIDVPADVKAKLRSLLDFFDDTWVGNRLGKGFLSMLLLGPGTTNHAEGYHSRLRDHFPRCHPKLGEWMVIFKELNNHEEEKAAEVLRGNVAPNEPSAGFQVVQQRRLDLRQRFDDFLATDFTSDEFRSESYKYLGRMANLLGINPQTRRQRRDARAEERARL